MGKESCELVAFGTRLSMWLFVLHRLCSTIVGTPQAAAIDDGDAVLAIDLTDARV